MALRCCLALKRSNIRCILSEMIGERKRYTRAELAVRTSGLVLMAGMFLLIAGLSAFSAWGMFVRARLAKQDALTAQADLVQITAEDNKAKAEVARLSSVSGLEAALRQRFGVVKPGEGVIVLLGAQAASSAAPVAATTTSLFGGWWKGL